MSQDRVLSQFLLCREVEASPFCLFLSLEMLALRIPKVSTALHPAFCSKAPDRALETSHNEPKAQRGHSSQGQIRLLTQKLWQRAMWSSLTSN